LLNATNAQLFRRSALWVGALLLAVAVGASIAMGGMRAAAGIAFVVVVAFVSLVPMQWVRRLPEWGWLSVEIPVFLMVLGTLVLRVRETSALADNPLDSAGMFRVGCVGAAGLLGGIAVLSSTHPNVRPRAYLTSLPFRLYVIYVIVVFIGVTLSDQPFITAFRAIELMAVVVVLAGACQKAGVDAVKRIQGVLYWFTVGMIASAWVGVLVAPSYAVHRVSVRFNDISTPLPWQIAGVFPTISANLLGALGVLLAFWSIGRLLSDDDPIRPFIAKALAALGIITLIAAQYRTGYVAALGATAVLLFMRKRIGIAAFLGTVAIVALLAGLLPTDRVQDFVLRGQDAENTSAITLSGRLVWWRAALDVWRESPILGSGLLTATRFEVFTSLGRETGSSIHGTWVEALVGTGIVGTLMLFSFAVACWNRALRLSLSDMNKVLPALILTVLTVRSLTGSSFEIFSLLGMVALSFSLGLEDRPAEAPAAAPTRVAAAS
jgi:O-antigen ligase